MSLITKLIVSLVIAVIAATLTKLVGSGSLVNPQMDLAFPQMLLAFFVATTATALFVRDKGASSALNKENVTQGGSTSDASRDRGTVKWFNISKGFGFITKDDGEEIFVHFRSIVGQRSLR